MPARPGIFRAVAPLLIVAAGLAAYSGSFSGPFVLDDPSSITDNPTIRQLWPPWDALATPRATVTVQGRPLLNLSFAINYAISQYDVWSYHALNVLIHILAGLTLYGIVRRTIAHGCVGPVEGCNPVPADGTTPAAAGVPTVPTATALGLAVALLWTVHPLQTESVTYVVQRAESLMGLFYLLTLYCFIRYAQAGSGPPPPRWAVWSVVACLAGMATKEVMVSAPVIVLLYDRTFVAGSFREAWRKRRAVHCALAGTWLLLGLCLLRGGGNRGGSIGLGTGVSWWNYFLTQFEAIGRYLVLSVWPHPLVFEYGAFRVEHASEVLPWAVILIPLVVGTVWALARRPVLGYLGGWFFAMLAPTSLIPGTSQMIVEHRMYLSLAAVAVLAVGAGYGLTLRLADRRFRWTPAFGKQAGSSLSALPQAVQPRSFAVLLAGLLALAVGFGWLTFQRNVVYRSGLELWRDTVEKRPANPLAHYLLAEELLTVQRFAEARQHLTDATRLYPSFSLAHERLGELLFRLGEPVAAATHFETALREKPDFADAHANLGNLLSTQGRMEEAASHLERALAISPDFAEAHVYLAHLYWRTGRTAEAIVHFIQAVRSKPRDALIHHQLATALADVGRNPEAVGHFQEALRLAPHSPATEYNLANSLAALQRHNEAVPHYRQALRLKPNYPTAEYNLANSLIALNRREEAVAHYQEALRLQPDNTAAEVNLGSVLLELGRFAEAEGHYLAALRLDPGSAEIRTLLERARASRGR